MEGEVAPKFFLKRPRYVARLILLMSYPYQPQGYYPHQQQTTTTTYTTTGGVYQQPYQQTVVVQQGVQGWVCFCLFTKN